MTALFSVLPIVFPKNTFCRQKFNQADWIYCTKFGADTTSTLNVQSRAKFIVPYKKSDEQYQIQVGIYTDSSFEEVRDKRDYTCAMKRDKALDVITIQVPAGGGFSEKVNTVVYNSLLPRIYFFVVMDCDKYTINSMPKMEVEFDIVSNFKDGEGNHFSYEEQGIFGLHIMLFIIYLGLFGFSIWSYIQYQKIFEDLQSPHFIILLALILHIGGVFFECLHYWMYSYNGRGIPVFDIFGNIFFMLSEISFSAMLMMIAYGWTINFKEVDVDSNLDIYLPIGILVVVVHLILAALTYVDIDAYHKYHDFAGVQGWCLIVLKLCLFTYYIYIVATSKQTIPKRSMEFYTIFTILGSVYMLTVPLTILISFFFQPYSRSYIFTMNTNLVQLIAAILMLWQIQSTKSKYFYASLNSQGILPMAKNK